MAARIRQAALGTTALAQLAHHFEGWQTINPRIFCLLRPICHSRLRHNEKDCFSPPAEKASGNTCALKPGSPYHFLLAGGSLGMGMLARTIRVLCPLSVLIVKLFIPIPLRPSGFSSPR